MVFLLVSNAFMRVVIKVGEPHTTDKRTDPDPDPTLKKQLGSDLMKLTFFLSIES